MIPGRPKRSGRLDRLPARRAQGEAASRCVAAPPCSTSRATEDVNGITMMARISAAASIPTPSGGPEKSGSFRSPVGRQDLRARARRDEHEDAPEAVHDRGDRREQLREECQRRAQRRGAKLREEDGDAERDGRGDQQGEEGRVERAPDERQRAELAGHRIPDFRGPELETEFLESRDETFERAHRRSRRPGERRSGQRTPSPGGNRDHRRSGAGTGSSSSSLRRARLDLDLLERFHLERDDLGGKRRIAEIRPRTSGRRSAPTS